MNETLTDNGNKNVAVDLCNECFSLIVSLLNVNTVLNRIFCEPIFPFRLNVNDHLQWVSVRKELVRWRTIQ